MTTLILGGTAEARALARALVEERRTVVSSLAGRVSDPALPAGEVRVGGFGGPAGLERFITERSITAVVDATHPFAAQMSRHARLATERAGTPLLRLARPGWSDHPRAGSWIWVADTTEAVQATDAARPFLTTGRQSLPDFLPWSEREVLVRVVDPPSFTLPPAWRLIRSRGPYALADERRLMLDDATDALVTKDSGGDYTSAKLDAAGELGLPVVVIARPPVEAGTVSVASVAAALEWCRARN
jgi:precorrin-6A/cobalt-precorrin-6A reductase